MERYRPDDLVVYFDNRYLRVSDSYHAILFLSSPSDAPVFKNLYNDSYKIGRLSGEIRGLSNSSIYSRIDLNETSPTRQMTDVKGSTLEFGFDGLTWYYAGDEQIYFCGRNDQDRNLAVFDRRRQEVIWSDIKHPISAERGHTKKIIVRDSRLYLLDFNDDLYTFELDSNGL